MTESRHEARRRCYKWRVFTLGAFNRRSKMVRQIEGWRWREGCERNKGEDESEVVVRMKV
jgi:hypothetical protein